MDHNASLLWALWHNIDQSELVPLTEELDRADTLSVRSEAPYKHTPTYAFPSRKSQYPETTRLKAMQNEVRTRFCSTLPDKDKSDDTQLLTVHAKPSTCEYNMVFWEICDIKWCIIGCCVVDKHIS